MAKMFTKAIDNKLFSQYSKGSNLGAQKIVAKIFNPYGKGTWFLLNSDPDDPDYLYGIVDFDEVEVGSFLRSDLENMKVPPFGLPLERELYESFDETGEEMYQKLRNEHRSQFSPIHEVIEEEEEEIEIPKVDNSKTIDLNSLPSELREANAQNIKTKGWGDPISASKMRTIVYQASLAEEAGVPKNIVSKFAVGTFVKTEGEVQDTYASGMEDYQEDYIPKMFKELIDLYKNNEYESGFKYMDITDKDLGKLGFKFYEERTVSYLDFSNKPAEAKYRIFITDDFTHVMSFNIGSTYAGLFSEDFLEGYEMAKKILNKATYVKDVDFFRNGIGGISAEEAKTVLIEAISKKLDSLNEEIDYLKSDLDNNDSFEHGGDLDSINAHTRALTDKINARNANSRIIAENKQDFLEKGALLPPPAPIKVGEKVIVLEGQHKGKVKTVVGKGKLDHFQHLTGKRTGGYTVFIEEEDGSHVPIHKWEKAPTSWHELQNIPYHLVVVENKALTPQQNADLRAFLNREHYDFKESNEKPQFEIKIYQNNKGDEQETALKNFFKENSITYDFPLPFEKGGRVRRTKSQIAQDEYESEVDKYKWFVINPKTKQVLSGYESREDAEDYRLDFDVDDDGRDAKEFKTVSKQELAKRGIADPTAKWKSMESGGETDYQTRHNYMLLSRMQSDCEYFLGWGNGSTRHLYSGNVPDQIAEMKALWNGFPEDGKPEWLTMEQINDYETKMLAKLNETENPLSIDEYADSEEFANTELQKDANVITSWIYAQKWSDDDGTLARQRQNKINAFQQKHDVIVKNSFEKGGKITDSDIKVGNTYKLRNGEQIVIKKIFTERGTDELVGYERAGKYEETTVRQLRIFINNWKADSMEKGGKTKSNKRYIPKSLEGYKFPNVEHYYTAGQIGIFDTEAGMFTNLNNDREMIPYSLDWKVAQEIADMQNSGEIKEEGIYLVPHIKSNNFNYDPNEQQYYVVSITKDGYWVVSSKKSTKQLAEQLKDVMIPVTGETLDVKTVAEVQNHKKTLYERGGITKTSSKAGYGDSDASRMTFMNICKAKRLPNEGWYACQQRVKKEINDKKANSKKN